MDPNLLFDSTSPVLSWHRRKRTMDERCIQVNVKYAGKSLAKDSLVQPAFTGCDDEVVYILFIEACRTVRVWHIQDAYDVAEDETLLFVKLPEFILAGDELQYKYKHVGFYCRKVDCV